MAESAVQIEMGKGLTGWMSLGVHCCAVVIDLDADSSKGLMMMLMIQNEQMEWTRSGTARRGGWYVSE